MITASDARDNVNNFFEQEKKNFVLLKKEIDEYLKANLEENLERCSNHIHEKSCQGQEHFIFVTTPVFNHTANVIKRCGVSLTQNEKQMLHYIYSLRLYIFIYDELTKRGFTVSDYDTQRLISDQVNEKEIIEKFEKFGYKTDPNVIIGDFTIRIKISW